MENKPHRNSIYLETPNQSAKTAKKPLLYQYQISITILIIFLAKK